MHQDLRDAKEAKEIHESTKEEASPNALVYYKRRSTQKCTAQLSPSTTSPGRSSCRWST